MKKEKWRRTLFYFGLVFTLVLSAGFLTSCNSSGDGNGGGSPSSNWDQIIWDQDNWG